MMNSINFIEKENNAFKELFSIERNDLDINHFKNKFSSNFLQFLDDYQLDNINRKFPFFESFINKIKNICLEVETHTDSNAILISRTEYEDAIKVMIEILLYMKVILIEAITFLKAVKNLDISFLLKN